MNPSEYEISVIADQSKRSFVADSSQIKQMSKQQTTTSVDKKSFEPTKKNDSQLLQRVCCLRINRKWRIKKQIFVTTFAVFLIVLSIVTAFIGVLL